LFPCSRVFSCFFVQHLFHLHIPQPVNMMMSKSTMMSKPRAAVRTNATKRVAGRGKGASGDYGWYPEPGTYIGSGAPAWIEEINGGILGGYDDKNTKLAEREIIHGRWAMLGLTGAWASEVGTGVPWFEAGALCTPADCTAIADKFPGAIYPLAPPDSGFPNFFNVLAIEIVFVGLAEAYRTGLIDPIFSELSVGDANPGGRFDPLNLASASDLEELKVKEVKHCRLAMFGWAGVLVQWPVTGKGPITNWAEHVADPWHYTIVGKH